jgi:hypothetical protein
MTEHALPPPGCRGRLSTLRPLRSSEPASRLGRLWRPRQPQWETTVRSLQEQLRTSWERAVEDAVVLVLRRLSDKVLAEITALRTWVESVATKQKAIKPVESHSAEANGDENDPRRRLVAVVLQEGTRHSRHDSEADTFNAPCRHRRRQIGDWSRRLRN